jgi:hypothetical protein
LQSSSDDAQPPQFVAGSPDSAMSKISNINDMDGLEAAKFYLSLRLNAFPLAPASKKPRIGFSWKPYQHTLVTEQNLREWFSPRLCNIAVICGHVSGGLLVQDFEGGKDAEKFYPNLERLGEETIIVETPHGGIHVYLRSFVEVKRTIRVCQNPPIDLLAEGGYVVAPPSIVDSKQYRVISNSKGILTVSDNPLTSIIDRCRNLGWKTSLINKSNRAFKPFVPFSKTPARALTEREKTRIANALIPFWQRGRRHQLSIYLLAMFVKRGIGEEDARDVVLRICDQAGDEEKGERLSQVSYHYRKPPSTWPRLKGFAGLREILEVD